jgi:hypothetical protein
VPQAALAWWTWSNWENIGGPLMLDRLPLSWGVFRVGAAGLLVDRENGLFVWAPLLLATPAAWAVRFSRDRWLIPVTALFAASAAHDQWWGGFAPAGRFLVPLPRFSRWFCHTRWTSAVILVANAAIWIAMRRPGHQPA